MTINPSDGGSGGGHAVRACAVFRPDSGEVEIEDLKVLSSTCVPSPRGSPGFLWTGRYGYDRAFCAEL